MYFCFNLMMMMMMVMCFAGLKSWRFCCCVIMRLWATWPVHPCSLCASSAPGLTCDAHWGVLVLKNTMITLGFIWLWSPRVVMDWDMGTDLVGMRLKCPRILLSNFLNTSISSMIKIIWLTALIVRLIIWLIFDIEYQHWPISI